MKNMAVNQKLILLMLMTALLMCWAQGVSHGGGAASGTLETVGAVGGGVGTAIGASGTVLGLSVGILADSVELTVGVVGLTVELTALIVLLPAYGIASDIVVFPNEIVGIVSFNHINLWAPDKLGLMLELSHSSPLTSIASHPGGGIFASGSEDSNIQLWNLQTERLDATLRGHTSSVLNVAFSSDGSLLASGGADGTVRLWNPATQTLQATLEAHMDSVLSVAFSPDGSLLASASADGLVGLWDPVTKTLQATLGHESPVPSVDFSPDGKMLASGSADGTARLWDFQTMKVLATLGHESPVKNVAFAPDGSALITRSEDGTVRQWTVTISPDGIRDTSEPLHTLTGHEEFVHSVAFSPDGQTLAIGSGKGPFGSLRLWNPNTGEPLLTLRRREEGINILDPKGTVHSVAFSPDGHTLASGSSDDTIRLWNPNTGTLLRELTTERAASIGILDTLNPLNPRIVHSVAFSPDGHTLASGSSDDTIRLWNPNTGTLLRELTTEREAGIGILDSFNDILDSFNPRGIVHSVAFSPDRHTLASGSGDNTVSLWSTSTGALLRELTTGRAADLDALTNPLNPEGGIHGVAFSPDGQMLASGSSDNTVSLWNPNTGALLHTLTEHKGDVNSVAFSPNGQTLASGGDDNTVRLWDANTGELLRILTGPGAAVNSIAFSPDGGTLAGGSDDDTVRLWEVIPNTTVGSRDDTLVGVIPNTTVSLLPVSVQSPLAGEQLTFNIEITGGVKVAGYQATIQFDTTALRYVEGVNGDYLLPNVFFVPPVVDGNRVTLNATSLAGETKGDGTLATLTFEVVSAKASTLTLSEVNLVSSAGKKTHPTVEGAQITEPALGATLDADVNGDGSVDAQDLVIVTEHLGQTGPNSADVNGDGVVDIADLTVVAGAIGNSAAAPSLYPQLLREFTIADVKLWLSQAQQLDLTDPRVRRGILFLEQLLAALIPKETALLPNYPNPFNPETWIPYRLAEDAFVTLTIYDSMGQVVRTLDVGHRRAAFYESRSKAIYWDGRNEFGEQVVSGLYFYHLSAGDYSATRRMLILK